jgi:hypothetical protein
MKLLPAAISLIKYGTPWMPFAPIIVPVAWMLSGFRNWSWFYHVEMVWDTLTGCDGTQIGYKAFSLQPPVLDIVSRNFADIRCEIYQLKDRPDDLTDKFWRWGNDKILHQPYVLGLSTCGHHIVNFYGLDCQPYPGPIEDVCNRSGRFEKVR